MVRTEAFEIRRHFDLDWLRIIAFALLIFYHTGMFYVTWDWHVKSDRASDEIEPLMQLVNPWRLDLLFLISGVATRFMADRFTPGRLAWSRVNRLLWPLIFSILVIVPPQSFLEITEKINYTGGVVDFYRHYLSGYGGWCRGKDCLIVPTWNHMWFVAYLLVYSLILAALLPLRRLLAGFKLPAPPVWSVFLLPWAYLWLCDTFLWPRFNETHALVNDWYLHANDGGLFLAGFALGKSEGFFRAAQRWRWPALMLGLAAYGTVMAIYHTALGQSWRAPDLFIFRVGLREAQAWLMIMALIGFARQHLAGCDNPARRILTEAVFPFYIIHQTLIVVLAHWLNGLHFPLAAEVTALLALTMLGCATTYLVARKWGPLRLLFGLPQRVIGWSRRPKPEALRS